MFKYAHYTKFSKKPIRLIIHQFKGQQNFSTKLQVFGGLVNNQAMRSLTIMKRVIIKGSVFQNWPILFCKYRGIKSAKWIAI